MQSDRCFTAPVTSPPLPSLSRTAILGSRDPDRRQQVRRRLVCFTNWRICSTKGGHDGDEA
ncbi:hypothetical protein IL54_0413 [Sphingobium sp. ba1]|nr:hypothetical protein IL54_0413 [Sphingobium sp. ba1]